MPKSLANVSTQRVLDRFQPAVAEWFRASFPAPTRAQELAWPDILERRSTLLCAPTGSGKTLAAFWRPLNG